MPGENSVLKAKLMAKAEALIDELLAAQKPSEETQLVDIEQAVLGLGQRLQRALTAELVAAHTAVVEATGLTCPQCGGKLKAKGKRTRRVLTEMGDVSVRREYYHCAACGTGVFPPG